MKLFSKFFFGRLLLIVIIAGIGGISGVMTDRVLLPNIAADSFFSRWEIFRKASENTVIINKTEQVIIREDDSVTTIAASASPSVVNILSVKRVGSEIGKVGEPSSDQQDMLQGSGVLVTNDGLIATFHKAILEGASYTVFLYNGASYSAEFSGTDALTGISFLKVSPENLPAISFADPESVHAGEKLILIANTSEEYRNRYSTGLLGNADKTFNIAGGVVASSERWEGVFTVDAATLEPYVGGPAVDYQGKLVGIVGNSLRDGKVESFLLPSVAVKESLERKVRGTLLSRPFLGVSFLSITKAYAVAHGIGRDRGALIFTPSGKQGLAVFSGSPAEKAGLRVGDIVVAVDGKEINLDNPLSVAVGNFEKGNTVVFRILRGEKEQDIGVTL